MAADFDVCVIGSGAGGGPVAFSLATAGYSVVVLEKGPWLKEGDFFKDEVAAARRTTWRPDRRDEPHVIETEGEDGWVARPSAEGSVDLWNGNCVGGASNFMSGFFHRLKPQDFKLRSTFGPIEGADVVDWPISYEDLEPYYDRVEREVGISGRVIEHPDQEPRSRPQPPFPPTVEHPIAGQIDDACEALGFHSVPTLRAILSTPVEGRRSCEYSGYCGSFGCATGAKGSSRAALLDRALATGRCEIRPHSMVSRLRSDERGRVTEAEYFDADGVLGRVDARIFVVACQAVESARLLLRSVGPRHPDGLGNGSGQLGQNLLFAGGGAGSGWLPVDELPSDQATAMLRHGPFINRSLQQWNTITDVDYGGPMKGGTIDFVRRAPAPIARAVRQIHGPDGLRWGPALKRRLEQQFRPRVHLKIEAFCDWLPVPDCRVSLDPVVRDRWGLPSARVRLGFHLHNLMVGWYLASRGAEVLEQLGARDIIHFAVGSPPTNLQAGGCRFGTDPERSVLDPDCRAHEAENLFVADGSFMPTGGSVPYTWTIYANAFRVADRIAAQLGGA